MFEEQENDVVLNENSVEGKPCINRESKSDGLTIQLYSCYDINMKLLEVVTTPSIYHNLMCGLYSRKSAYLSYQDSLSTCTDVCICTPLPVTSTLVDGDVKDVLNYSSTNPKA